MTHVDARQDPSGRIILAVSQEDAIILHEAIAHAEFANDLAGFQLREPVEQNVFSDLQQALAPLIPGLGTPTYQNELGKASAAIDPGEFRPLHDG